MINHFRTLLLTVPAAKTVGDGSEIVPAEFMPPPLTGPLHTLHRLLFGDNPDAAVFNTRVFQYLTVVDATQLRFYTAALDSRITYNLRDNQRLYRNYGVSVRAVGDTVDELVLLDTEAERTASGRTRLIWNVSTTGGNVVVTNQLGDTVLTDAASTSTIYSLPGVSLKFRLMSADNGLAWRIQQTLRPDADTAKVLADLRSAGSALEQVFEPAHVEPYTTFRNVWRDHPVGTYKMAAALCAYVYRVHDLWTLTQNA